MSKSTFSIYPPGTPLLTGDGLQCIISNIGVWLDYFSDEEINGVNYEWLEEHNIEVKGCAVTFPDEETKVLFMLKYGQ